MNTEDSSVPRPGLYERLIDAELEAALSAASPEMAVQRTTLDDAEAPDTIADHLATLIRSVLEVTHPTERIARANQVVQLLDTFSPSKQLSPVTETEPLLLAVGRSQSGLTAQFPPRPEIPLSQSDILMNARGEPSMLRAIMSELHSADHIRIIVSFIKWSGLRHLLPSLKTAASRGVRIQVLTTTYLGASDERALTALAEAGAEVRVSYDNRSSRLHAKAWLFDRNSGAHTGYVGSSNMSHQAFNEGQEWNVRLSQPETPHLLTKFRNAFDAYWVEPSFGFERYDPAHFPEDRDRLLAALQVERHTNPTEQDSLLPFEVRPYPYQQEILDALDRDRRLYGRTRNLVVAATGTGKTVIAALDYARLWKSGDWAGGSRAMPKLLFLAHRKEILEQSRRVFRHVLRDLEFGELLVAGSEPSLGTHVFASIQSLSEGDRLGAITPSHFDIIIIDEVHHAPAGSWTRAIEHFDPRLLLGLTATPERADGESVTAWFDHHITAELRLWDALERDLLVPFHYFAVGNTELDFRCSRWSNGKCSAEDLEKVYTGNEAIMQWVVAQVRDKVTDPNTMRALVFTSGIGHATKVARDLNASGIRSAVVTGETSAVDRRQALLNLRSGDLQAVVTVDVFNEGLDIPDVDTILMLRPTESLTVFLQQLGRGLRKAEGKSVLTVLDFVGQHRKEFRFASRLTALTGIPRGGIERAISDGFPYLPSGVVLRLDQVAADLVVKNLKESIPTKRSALIQDVKAHAEGRSLYRLTQYLSDAQLSLEEFYSNKDRSWLAIKQASGLLEQQLELDLKTLRRVRALAHVDDLPRIAAYRRLLSDPDFIANIESESLLQQRWAYMLYHTVFDSIQHSDLVTGLKAIHTATGLREELLELLAHLAANIPHVTYPESLRYPDIPLAVHARYNRSELLSAVGEGNWQKTPNNNREGVVHAKDIGADVFRMTWHKSERDYSPKTMYRDFAISGRLIHWQSQHHDRANSPKIQRYIEHVERGQRILLFARESKQYEMGTAPFIYLGEATYVSHASEQPVSFVWELQREMPTDFARKSILAAS